MFFVCTMLSFNPLSSMYEVLYDDGERATEPLDVGDKNDPDEEEQTVWMRQTIRMDPAARAEQTAGSERQAGEGRCRRQAEVGLRCTAIARAGSKENL